jgi:CheY-like chemotaxis protein
VRLAEELEGSGRVARVLIVDDSQMERVILGTIIGQAGHECHFASGGLEALETYLRGGLDIVVTDLEMPDGGGLELIEGLRAMLPEAPIIVVSGMRPEVLTAAGSKGAFAAFSKPVDPQELLEAIAQAAPG